MMSPIMLHSYVADKWDSVSNEHDKKRTGQTHTQISSGF